MQKSPETLMALAIELASLGKSSDLPIAAVIVDPTGFVIATARNSVLEKDDPTAHAEMEAIRALGVKYSKHGQNTVTLAVTLEPCPMCSWAIRAAGISRVVFGAYNPQYGAAGSVFDLLRDTRYGSPVEVVGGVLELQCRSLLGDAFSRIRNKE